MLKVILHNPHSYSVTSAQLRKAIAKILTDHDYSADVEIPVALVNVAEMTRYAQEYLGETGSLAASHPVLSFPIQEIVPSFHFPPGHASLGEIIISYPKAVAEAQKSGKTSAQVVCELAQHATLHLLGIHHD